MLASSLVFTVESPAQPTPATAPAAHRDPAAGSGAFATGRYRNLFQEFLGRSEAELDAKIAATWQQFAHGDPDTQRLFYTVPGDMAYIPDVNNNDVRTEGMSYGMMLAVQLDRQAEFDALWRWVKTHMYHESGPYAGYFAWHCRTDGTQLHAGPAPDGEEWFVMSLFFAAHRWGSRASDSAGRAASPLADADATPASRRGRGSAPDPAALDPVAGTGAPPGIDYEAEAQALLRTMLHKGDGGDGSVTSMFDRAARQVVFVPHPPGATFTDPSYHLPAFYELWARWAADPADRAFLAEVAATSRALFHRAAHPKTGLMPDYTAFDGTPFARRGHEHFRFDAFRTMANVALDHAWFAKDPWQVGQSNRVLAFLAGQGPDCPNNFTLDGRPLTQEFSPGLFAMAAVAALAADTDDAHLFVQRLWEMKMPEGRERYYDGMLHFLALLQVGGRYRIHAPP